MSRSDLNELQDKTYQHSLSCNLKSCSAAKYDASLLCWMLIINTANSIAIFLIAIGINVFMKYFYTNQ